MPAESRPAPPEFPEFFTRRMTDVLGSRDALERLLQATSRPGLRVNTLKASVREVKDTLAALGVDTRPVPFAGDHLLIETDMQRGTGQFWEHSAGWWFGQDAASRLPVIALDPRPGEKVLDLCASPGGKTTDIVARMGNRGLVVANEAHPQRANMLVNNLDRCGAMNAVVTRLDATGLMQPILFDKVIVDAPCSNLGALHTDWGPAFKFTEHKTQTLQGMQKALLHSAFHAAREGGVIVYATCTLEPGENEGVASWFRENYPVEVEKVPVGLKSRALAADGPRYHHDEVAERAVRLHPGDAETDGFFTVRFRKVGDLPAEGLRKPRRPKRMEPTDDDAVTRVVKQYGLDHPLLEDARAVSTGKRLYATTVPDLEEVQRFPFMHMGLYWAKPEKKGDRLAFDAATFFGATASETFELTDEDARRWITGEDLTCEGPRDWRVVTCRGQALGAARQFGSAFQSFVPKERRIVVREGEEQIGFLARARTGE